MTDDRARYTIVVEKADNGRFYAFEPAADNDIKGRGKTRAEAIWNYAGAYVHDEMTDEEVAADD